MIYNYLFLFTHARACAYITQMKKYMYCIEMKKQGLQQMILTYIYIYIS